MKIAEACTYGFRLWPLLLGAVLAAAAATLPVVRPGVARGRAMAGEGDRLPAGSLQAPGHSASQG
jgi:hypothetical protein